MVENRIMDSTTCTPFWLHRRLVTRVTRHTVHITVFFPACQKELGTLCSSVGRQAHAEQDEHDLLLADRDESTWEMNTHTPHDGHFLSAAPQSHARWPSSLPGDTEGPTIPMQVGLHPVMPGKPEPSLLGCEHGWAGPAEGSGVRAGSPPAQA